MASSTAYIDAADFILLIDQRTIKQLTADTGASVSTLTGDSNFDEIIKVASGKAEAILVAHNRYTATTLATILANDDVATSYLKEMVAKLVVVEFYERRPYATLPPEIATFKREVCSELMQIAVGNRVLV